MSHYLRINTDSGFDKPQHGKELGIRTLEGTVTREFLAERQPTTNATEGAGPSIDWLAKEIAEKAILTMTGQTSYLRHIVKCAEWIQDRLATTQKPASDAMREARDQRTLFYTILSKYIPQESIDQAWQEIKEAGIFQ